MRRGELTKINFGKFRVRAGAAPLFRAASESAGVTFGLIEAADLKPRDLQPTPGNIRARLSTT